MVNVITRNTVAISYTYSYPLWRNASDSLGKCGQRKIEQGSLPD